MRERNGRLHRLIGRRDETPLDADVLRALAPDLVDRDVFVCGPEGFMARVLSAARDAGVPRDRCPHESFNHRLPQ